MLFLEADDSSAHLCSDYQSIAPFQQTASRQCAPRPQRTKLEHLVWQSEGKVRTDTKIMALIL
jgi:hypothetical protein